jgi:hypothetical protein
MPMHNWHFVKTKMWHEKWFPLFYNHTIIQVKLTSVNKKIEYQIIKIFGEKKSSFNLYYLLHAHIWKEKK